MFVASAGRAARQGAASVLAAWVAVGQILSPTLAVAEPARESVAIIKPAATVPDVPTESVKHSVLSAGEPMHVGNPLWSLPLSALSGTRERPIFSPSRRPPPPPAVAAPFVPSVGPPQPPSKTPEPDHPLLILLGTLTGDSQGVAIFLNEADKTTLRLRTGEGHGGWVLHSIRGGEVTFEKGERTATLAMAPLGSAAQTHASQMALGNTWRDGDGQMIHAPPRPEHRPSPPMEGPPRNTWLDGDGQVISPPRQSPPSRSMAAPRTVDPAL